MSELEDLLAALQSSRPKVHVTMKKSSTKDSGEGFDLDVAYGATADDVATTVREALEGRRLLLEALDAPLNLGLVPDA